MGMANAAVPQVAPVSRAPAYAAPQSNPDSASAKPLASSGGARLDNRLVGKHVDVFQLAGRGGTNDDRSSKVFSERQAWVVIHHHPRSSTQSGGVTQRAFLPSGRWLFLVSAEELEGM
jgi:hypothetical protein